MIHEVTISLCNYYYYTMLLLFLIRLSYNYFNLYFIAHVEIEEMNVESFADSSSDLKSLNNVLKCS